MTRKPTILVVDDDLPILMLMQTVLREFGFESITATSGQEAIGLVRQQRPALVLLDKHMPGMPNDEVVRTLRAEFKELPILLLSGDPVSKAEAAAMGVDGAVQKPFDVVALIAQIRSHLMDGGGASQ